MQKAFLEAGKIVNKRGLAGELKVENYCDSPEVFSAIHTFYADENGSQPRKVKSCKWYRGYAYLYLEGVDSAEAADALKNHSLYASREDIPVGDGDVFIEDMVGLPVYDADSERVYGTLAEVFNRGASDLYRIVSGENEYLMPAVKEFVVSVDTTRGIAVRPIPGMFDDAEEIRS